MAERPSVEDRIGDATLSLLRSGGPRSVTIEAVAAASGVAKTTIYRRYRDRREVLSTALTRLVSPAPLDPQAGPPDRLRWLIKHAIETVEDGVGVGGVAAMLTDEDPEFTTLFRQILVEQRGHLKSVIDAGKADGSIRADIDSATLIDAIVGAYLAEHARGETLADDWQHRLFDLFWPAVQASEINVRRRL
ncbi:MAG TPA: TetR/AcrR family transcriptional regulator [Mycobacterium sp.]|nr:TetR/AcrR family transcriptional regulator [Mycobacterium sp.]